MSALAPLPLAPPRKEEGNSEHPPAPQILRRPGAHRRRASPAPDPLLAAPDRARHRRYRRHRHLHLDRRRRRAGGAGGDPVLRDRRRGLRLRRSGLRRDGDHDPGGGQRLHLHLHGARRELGLDRRLEPDPGIHRGLQRGRGRLVRPRGGVPAFRAASAPGGAGGRRDRQPAGHPHLLPSRGRPWGSRPRIPMRSTNS